MSPLSDDRDVVTLTILFTDLVSSTELFTTLGDDAADTVRARHFAFLRRAVASHAGREVKGLGDGMLACFTSASAAVGCAVSMQRSIRNDARPAAATPMQIRIGVSTGDVTTEGGDCFGEAVTEASRLCAAAAGGQILVSDATRAVLRGRGNYTLRSAGALELRGLREPVLTWDVEWGQAAVRPLRVVLADDAVLLREGVARVLAESGMDIVAQAGDAAELMRCVERSTPDIAITDIRMPPTNTLEGLEAAERICALHPGVSVLVLSQHLDKGCARRLLDTGERGVGYLLKERVGDLDDFVEAIHRVAAGEIVLDPDLGIDIGVPS